MKWLTNVEILLRMLRMVTVRFSLRVTFIVCAVSFQLPNFAQIGSVASPSPISISSDNAKSSLISMENDPFNGRVNVSRQIFRYSFEGMDFPIVLYYTGSNGIKPDELPGWVGNGWGLTTGGGFVHRIVRNRPDEVEDYKYVKEKITTYSQGLPTINTTIESDIHANNFSYFHNKSVIGGSNWASNGISFRGTSIKNAPYDQTINNLDVTLDRTTYNIYPHNDLASDEYSFSVGNISGKFYLHYDGQWIVQSNDGKKYDIDVFEGNFTIDDKIGYNGGRLFVRTSRVIKYFKITSADGFEYTFGTDNANATFKEQCFEYSRTSNVSGQSFPNIKHDGNVEPFYIGEIVPHTWHLTKIVNKKTGSEIKLNYKNTGAEIYQKANAWGSLWNTGSASPVFFKKSQIILSSNYSPDPTFYHFSGISGIWTRKWTLADISFPNNFKFIFNSSESNQLSSNSVDNFEESYDVTPGKNTLMQLDSIQIKQNENAKTYVFKYQNSPSNRLQLLSVLEKSTDNRLFLLDSFLYNSLSLPPYASRKVDHWGYYNNSDFFISGATSYTLTQMQQYSASREPNTNYVTAEILQKVYNSNGGYSEFEYEPHNYSQYQNQSGIVIPTSGNTIAGGVRIKNVKHYLSPGLLANQTNFSYLNSSPDYSGQSSGVLGTPISEYLTPSDANFTEFRASGFSPIQYRGSHVTYTDVSVFQANVGKTDYTYSNFDNGYGDKPPLVNQFDAFVSGSLGSVFSNTGFKRGKLMRIKTYSNDNTLLQEKKLKYEHDFDHYNAPTLRSIYYWNYAPDSYAAVLDTIYQDRLREETVQHFSQGNALIEQTKYSYDSLGNIKESIGPDGKGGLIKTKYKYAHEYIETGSDEISQGIAFQKNLGIKNCLVEKLVIAQNSDGSNARIIDGVIYTYHLNKAFPYKEYKLQSNVSIAESGFESKISGGVFQKDSRYNTSPEITFAVYDASGNVLESVDKTGIKTSYLLGYNKQYVVAKIIGADHLTVSGLVDSLVLNNPSSDGALRLELNKIRTGLHNSHAQIYTYTHVPLVGMTSETGPTNQTTYYQYDNFGRLSAIRDHEFKLVKQICYNYQGQQVDCNLLPVYRNKLVKETISKKDCASGGLGTNVDYTIPAGTYTSEISQDDADQKALNDIAANGQNYANQHGECKAIVTVKNNGTSGTIMGSIEIVNQNNEIVGTAGVGSPGNTTVLYISPGSYTIRFVSPGATALFDINGTQVLAQTNTSSYQVVLGNFNIDGAVNVYAYPQGSYFGNTYMSQNITRNNCTGGLSGTAVTYTVPADKYYSVISQADANQKALNEIAANGQNYANNTGSCVQNVNITLYASGSLGGSIEFIPSGASSGYSSSFPSSGTHPIQVPAGTYYVKVTTGSSRLYSLNYYINGPSFQMAIPSGQYSATSSSTITLSSGTNYIVQPPTN